MTDEFALSFLLIAGILGCIGALSFKLGRSKAVFLPLPLNTQAPRYYYYGLLPIGIGCLMIYAAVTMGNRTLLWCGILGIPIFALGFTAWKPRWLEPKWMTWLRDRYDWSMLEYMFQQAKRDRHWGERVSTQEGLEAWAREMEERHLR